MFLGQLYTDGDKYIVSGSVGQGNWAKVPWVAVLDSNVTTSVQEGLYVCYLLSEDGKRMYLTLMQGVGRNDSSALKQVRDLLRKSTDFGSFTTDDNITLSDSHSRAKQYELATVCYKVYTFESIPAEEQLLEDLKEMLTIYDHCASYLYGTSRSSNTANAIPVEAKIARIKDFIDAKGFVYPEGFTENFYLSLKTKPFVILAGISGTGKTQLVRQFAQAIGVTEENGQFTLIPVRPDWNDSSDLLGYNNIRGEFQPGPLMNVVRKACSPENRDKIYIVCLDEMNLSRVEYYFSDILSVIETRRWFNKERVVTDKLLPEESIQGSGRQEYSMLYLPSNLFLVGTVNMDETTYPFSKKVLDRANTIELSQVRLDLFGEANPQSLVSIELTPRELGSEFITLSDCLPNYASTIESVVEELVLINEILKRAWLQFGYRVRDEICFYMIYNEQYQLLSRNEAFDNQIMQKILPRIQGSSSEIQHVLKQLFELLAEIDLTSYVENLGNSVLTLVNNGEYKYPKSLSKLAYMLHRYEVDGFTSFWL